MINVTLKQLRYFETLARIGHFGRAADALSISQPALSVQVRDLEETLGVTLIERGPRQLRLTAIGAQTAEHARGLLRQVDELGDLARAAQGPIRGDLRLGVIPTIAPYLLPRVIAQLGETYPGLGLRPREAVTDKLVAGLLEGTLDAALVALPISEPSLHEEPLFAEDFVLVRHIDEADAPVPRAEDLRAMRLLLLEEGHCFRDQALSFCELGPARTRDLMEGSSLSTLVQMVGAGIGVTLIPEMAVDLEARNAHVAVTHFDAPAPSRQVGLVWRRSSPLAEAFTAVAGLIRDAVHPPA